MNRIAICIPTFNQAGFLEKAVLSALAQTYPCEVWVSDDASTDGTPEIMTRLCGEFPELRFHRNKENQGIAANSSQLLSAPNTEYLIRLDSDDLLDPAYAFRLVSAMAKYPEAGYAHAAVREIDQTGKVKRIRRLSRPSGYLTSDRALALAPSGYRVAANICIFRRTALEECGFYQSGVNYGEDWLLSICMADRGWGNFYLDEVLASYRWWTDGAVRPRRKIQELNGSITVYEQALQPAFEIRKWSLGALQRARLNRAKGHSVSLRSPLFSKEEKIEMRLLLRTLADHPHFATYLKLVESPMGNGIIALRTLKNGLRRLLKWVAAGLRPRASTLPLEEHRIVMSHPTGNANVRSVLRALETSHLLATFHTTVGVSAANPLSRFAPRKTYPVSSTRLRLHPQREVWRLVAPKLRLAHLSHDPEGWGNFNAVCRSLDARVARELQSDRFPPRGVYAYEDTALETFRAAKTRGLLRIYDLPIAYWETARKLLTEEAERLPQWEPTLGGTRDSQSKLDRKTEELALANLVICPSEFVRQSIPVAALERPCLVAEFGSPSTKGRKPSSAPGAPLRLLFAGSMTQRKGLADVFTAMKLVHRKDVELVLMGSPVAGMEFYRNEYADFRYEPPRSHSRVLELMRTCDVLVLPSIVEGRALVQQEALSCGLPIVVTPNAGGEDLVIEGETGFLVPIRRPEVLAEKITWLADHREQLPDMAEASQQVAATRTWQRYEQKIVAGIIGLLEETD